MNDLNFTDLKGKTVLVTGTTRGIGKAIAARFLKGGCRVIALYRNNPPEFEGDFEHSPILLKNDVMDLNAMRTWLKDFVEGGDKIDVLVNNAGIYSNINFLEVKEEDWDRLMDINLKAVFFLSQMIADHMKDNGGGIIVNAASFAAKLSSLNYGVYAASKAAVDSLTKSMAASFAPYNIRVNAFSPGVIVTDMTKGAIEANKEKMLDAISLRKFGEVENVAEAVMFLCSEASSYITGINLDISGGKFLVQNPELPWK